MHVDSSMVCSAGSCSSRRATTTVVSAWWHAYRRASIVVSEVVAARTVAVAAMLACAPAAAGDGLADTVARVKPSIVVVGTFERLRSPQFVLRGTGFVIGDGSWIATNAHVVEMPPNAETGEVLAILSGSGDSPRRENVQLVAIDAEHDLALLRTTGTAPLPPLKLAGTRVPREGESIAFIGFPIGGALGFSPVTHRGIIASITPISLPAGNATQLPAKSIQRLRAGPFMIYQLDATAYPGNSGGPMIDPVSGDVLGILNMVFVKESKEAVLQRPSGISYAIPVSYLADLLARAIR